MVEYPPSLGRSLLFADLREIGFDFFFLPEGVEVVDLLYDDEQ